MFRSITLPFLQLLSTRSVRRAGVMGQDVMVCVADDALHIVGDRTTQLVIPLASIKHVLVGREPHYSTTGYRLQIWSGASPPVTLRAIGCVHDLDCYRDLLCAIGASMEARGSLGKMRIGMPRWYVFGMPMLVIGCFTIVALFGAEHPKKTRPYTPEEIVMIVFFILGIALVTAGWTLPMGFHRRVRSLADLDRVSGSKGR